MIEPATDQRQPQAIDRDRLRAALRLCFDGAQADALSALAWDGGEPDGKGLVAVVRVARARYGRARWLRRLRAPRSDRAAIEPLGPQWGLSTTGALALALHLGLDLGGDALAGYFGISPDRIGLELCAARRRVQDARPPCRSFASPIGRYRDPALAMHERAALLQHAQGCGACRPALDAARVVDEQLLGWIDWSQAHLPALETQPRARLARLDHPAILPLVGVLLLIALVSAGAAAVQRFGPSDREAVPLMATEPTAPLSGWLLETARGSDIRALDLATGQSRTLFQGTGNAFNQRLLSPNGQYLAVMATTPGFGGNTLEVHSLDGTMIRRWEWGESTRFSYLTGWRGNDMLLLVQGPGFEQGPTQEEALARQERESRLLALDVASGEERVLFQGSVSNALPSPDGTLVAISKVWDPRWPGFTVELRPFEGDGFGEPIAQIEHRYTDGGDPIWAPDSSQLYLAQIADDPIPTHSLEDAMQPSLGFTVDRVNLVALGRDGTVTQITEPRPGEHARLLGVSPHGEAIVYAQGTPIQDRAEPTPWSYWLVDSAGGNRRRLASADARFLWQSRVAWSSDGQTFLIADQEPFYLSKPTGLPGQPFGEVPMAGLLAFDASGEARGIVRARLTSGSMLSWLPSDALPPNRQPAGIDEEFLRQSIAAPVEWQEPPLHIEPWSSVSLDSSLLLLSQSDRKGSVIWNFGSTTTTRRPLASYLSDLSWFPDSGGLIGVSTFTDDERTRIVTVSTLSVTTATQTGENFDYQTFDPAGLGDDSARRYAKPLFSPDGTRISFFVIDGRQRSAALWVTGWGLSPRMVASWPLPVDARIDAPLIAEWVTADTLLVAVHQSWHDGLPGEVALQRIIVGGSDGARVDTLVTLHTRGNERGIALREFTQSPDGSKLAYRMRHYTQPDPDKARFDTVQVVRTSDVGDPLELARADPGDGLAWSPDSDWLAAPLHGRLMVYAANGRATVTVSPEGTYAALPLWLRSGDLWFLLDEGSGPRIVHLGGTPPVTRLGGGSLGGH